MERKGTSTTVAVSGEEVQAALSRARTLSSEEEKALRMRYGAQVVEPRAPLPRAAGSNQELADELLLIEMQLLKAYRARMGRAAPPARAERNPAKEKIVRALRKKK